MTAPGGRLRVVGGLMGAVVLTGLAGCATPGGSAAPSVGTSAASSSAALRACPAATDQPAQGAQTLPAVAFDCLGGGRLDLGRAPGVPTVVNLWASWCGPCRDELPLVQQLSAAAGDRLRVVGVVSKDGRPQARAFAADAGATFPSAFDAQGDLMTKLGLRGLPYTYLLDAHGAVVYTQVGPVTSEDQLRALVAQHLGVQL
jgi:thiol-disulfide isomerase/thioredoxin